MPKGPKVPRPLAPIFTIEESWEKLIFGFVYFRWHEGAENVAKIKKLVKVLRAEVEAARDDADLMDRTLQPQRRTLRERLDRAGLTGDPAAEWDYNQIADTIESSWQWRMGDPTYVRQYAAFIKALPITMHETLLELNKKFRAKHGGRGRPPSVAMEWMLRDADRMNVSDAALARRLADAGLEPEGPGSEETDLAMQWLDVIKAARHRARRRKVTK